MTSTTCIIVGTKSAKRDGNLKQVHVGPTGGDDDDLTKMIYKMESFMGIYHNFPTHHVMKQSLHIQALVDPGAVVSL